MTVKRVARRHNASRDIERASDYYSLHAGRDIALRFVAAVANADRAIGRTPGAGSLRFGEMLRIPGLRSRQVARFPYLIFYFEYPEHVEIVRVLHARSDILPVLSEERP